MTVADLKALLDTLPDDLLILHASDSNLDEDTMITDLVETSLVGHWKHGPGISPTFTEGGDEPANAICIQPLI